MILISYTETTEYHNEYNDMIYIIPLEQKITENIKY